MSYDLTFLPLPVNSNFDSAYRQWVEQQEREAVNLDDFQSNVLPEDARHRVEQMADALTSGWPKFVRFQPISPLPWIQLIDEEAQVQVTIRASSVGLSIPYFRDQVESMMRIIQCCLRILTEDFGFFAYDPQLGRSVTASDLLEVKRVYCWMDKPPVDVRVGAARPWWKFW